MSALFNSLGDIALGQKRAFAVLEERSLREFCRSTWLASLAYSRACTASGSIRIILGAARGRAVLDVRLDFLKQMSFAGFFTVVTLVALIALGLFEEGFQQPTIVLLPAVFHLMPKAAGASGPRGLQSA